MSSWSRAIVWSLIAAAFIGPGTVTTAARAGSEGGWHYIVFVLLAAFAGFLLMEMAARLTLVSGQTLGEILGHRGRALAWLCFGAVLLGCVAYEAGNLLGAVGGIQFGWAGGGKISLLILGVVAGLVLWPGNTAWVSRALAAVVALMGIIFVVAAGMLLFSGINLAGSGITRTSTIIGLVGTTIVPYNFFLAAGLSKGQKLREMRGGLLGSFAVGALITLSIVLVGSVTTSFTTFTDLALALDASIGKMSWAVLGFGLFAAGFSSAVTAPLAAALAGQQLLPARNDAATGPRSLRFRLIWMIVLAFGLGVAFLDLDILTVIFAAQVANGLLLPLLAAIVLVYANDRVLLGDQLNAHWQNVAGLLVAGYIAYKNFDLLLGKISYSESVDLWSQILVFIYVGTVAYLMYQRRQTLSAPK